VESEKRLHIRIPAVLPVRYSVYLEGEEHFEAVTGESTTRNISLSGMLLRWSKWWKCPSCPHAIDLDLRPPCRLEKCPYEELDHLLPISGWVEFDVTIRPEKVHLRGNGKIVWMRETDVADIYDLGVAFREVNEGGKAVLEELINEHIAKEEVEKEEKEELLFEEIPRLVMLSEPFRGQEFYLVKRSFSIGRSANNDLALPNLRVSREHAMIRIMEDKVMIFDLGSTNGTYVNGERIKHQELKDNDKIAIGPIEFCFKMGKRPAGAKANPSVGEGRE